jgi:hypothetical protein
MKRRGMLFVGLDVIGDCLTEINVTSPTCIRELGIQHPRKSEALASVELRDGEAIGTSGDYQRYFELDGERLCHLIDPRSGFPATATQAVTVLIPPGKGAGMRSDALSKPIFIAGADWAGDGTKTWRRGGAESRRRRCGECYPGDARAPENRHPRSEDFPCALNPGAAPMAPQAARRGLLQ